jgi:nucleoside-diphosphate-sugar epimerase
VDISIIGASGFIGSHLLKFLGQDFNALGISSSVSDDKANIVKISYSSLTDIERVTKNKDAFIFSAGPVDPRGVLDVTSQELIVNNVNLLELVADNFFRLNPEGKFIFISSAGALYDFNSNDEKYETCPILTNTFYGKLKHNQEMKLSEKYKNKNIIILRPTNIYGDPFKKNQVTGVIDKLIRAAILNESMEIFVNLNSTRDYLYIDDFCRAINLLLKKHTINNGVQVYNISSYEELSLNEIISRVEEFFPINQSKVKYLENNTSWNKLTVNSKKFRKEFNWCPKQKLKENLINIKQKMNLIESKA